ncbi:oxygen-independent coproporphyrinogen III oxidase [Roseomonas sp. CECT 9278]|uniref:oxygen-independent coproporphyrinogen III oxidase n=1 Tax=Roseomonas sp. CECT 9278 TaxID=2845823 RepID=UPI001E451407|nr:oxygen-independent coproporphyrinogen III oxidase [Roseomonas sp. CECT 9278]CAH0218532.1 Oxygen-independent coproporphyrinogen III oxidase [Roseomonas sp. CECT 9278]
MTEITALPAETLLRHAAAPLPRYTSYPTAPHFAPLDAATYDTWLRQAGPEDALSLYAHVPFCHALCWYCGCHTAVTRSAARIARYTDGLAREAAMVAERLPRHGGVAALHLGGGTPTALGAAGLVRLAAVLRGAFAFRPGAEVAAELDPRTLGADLLDALGAIGLTRASLGVQDITPAVQARIGRVQPVAMVLAAVRGLRALGVGGINIDLIYGLPGQQVAEIEASARFAADCGADRVAVFGYAHVPWMKPHQKAIRAEELPDAPLRLRQAEAAARVLTGAGYVAVGLDHFALRDDALARAAASGRLRRNFQGYTTDTAPFLVGLGASAIGAMPGGYAQNEAEERRWLAAIEAGRLPVARGLALSADDRIRGSLIERVMCDGAIATAAIPAEVMADAAPRIGALVAQGLVAQEGGRIAMTQAGRPFLRHLAACFDAYLAPVPARHSAAV